MSKVAPPSKWKGRSGENEKTWGSYDKDDYENKQKKMSLHKISGMGLSFHISLKERGTNIK